MSIFGNIMSKIFNHPKAAEAAAAPDFGDVQGGSSVTDPVPVAPTPMSEVDVEGVLTDMASKYSHPVNWRYSIVDLMSILGMDNSLAQRKELAKELGYSGDTSDSATMNVWLHKQVMQKLAENGGKVPADLLN